MYMKFSQNSARCVPRLYASLSRVTYSCVKFCPRSCDRQAWGYHARSLVMDKASGVVQRGLNVSIRSCHTHIHDENALRPCMKTACLTLSNVNMIQKQQNRIRCQSLHRACQSLRRACQTVSVVSSNQTVHVHSQI